MMKADLALQLFGALLLLALAFAVGYSSGLAQFEHVIVLVPVQDHGDHVDTRAVSCWRPK